MLTKAAIGEASTGVSETNTPTVALTVRGWLANSTKIATTAPSRVTGTARAV